MTTDPDYIAHRLLPEYVRLAAKKLGITAASYSDDWVLSLTRDGVTRFVHGYRFDINSSATGYNANDKVAASDILARAEVPVVHHELHQSVPDMFPVVIKPLHGTGGRGISKIVSVDEYNNWLAQYGAVGRWAVAPFEIIEHEYRVIMLDGEALVTYEKTAPQPGADKLTVHNLGQGATPCLIDDDRIVKIAQLAMVNLGLRAAAVDIVHTPDGLKVLEVNDGIMMEYFARHSDAYATIAQDVYLRIVQTMFPSSDTTHAIL